MVTNQTQMPCLNKQCIHSFENSGHHKLGCTEQMIVNAGKVLEAFTKMSFNHKAPYNTANSAQHVIMKTQQWLMQ